MNPFPFAIVGFDLDGTLLDTAADLGEAMNHALRSIGRPDVPAERVRELVGGGSRRMLERALALTGGMDGADLPSLHAVLLRHYEDNIAVHSRLFPGGEAMLDALEERGATLAIVTNKFESLAHKLLHELGFASRFCTIIGGDTLGQGRAKPAPDLLLEMVARCGGGRAAYVGDTTYDTRAAQAAGMPCVAISFGYNDLPPHELGADAVINHFDELVPALERL
ncbi:MAG: HAD-IA family hydrolase [Novosphingobium sp.]